MNSIDLMLLGLIAGFVFGGLRTGFVRRLAALGFLALSFVAAAYLREPIAGLIGAVVPAMRPEYPGLIGFAVAFGALLVVLNLAAKPFLERVAVSGMSRRTDQVLGAGLGATEGILLATIGIVVVMKYSADALLTGFTDLGLLPDVAALLEESTIARLLMDTTAPLVLTVLGPLLPSDILSAIDLPPTGE